MIWAKNEHHIVVCFILLLLLILKQFWQTVSVQRFCSFFIQVNRSRPCTAANSCLEALQIWPLSELTCLRDVAVSAVHKLVRSHSTLRYCTICEELFGVWGWLFEKSWSISDFCTSCGLKWVCLSHR